MKSNAFLFLSLAAFFVGGYLIGTLKHTDSSSHSPVPFHYVDYPEEISEVSHDENHPDLFEGMVRNDTLFFGYVPVPGKEDTMYVKNGVWFNTHQIKP